MKDNLKITLFSVCLSVLLLSCGKGKEVAEPEKVLPSLSAITVTSSGEYSVNDIAGDLSKTMDGKDITDDGGFETLYYSLEDGRRIPREYANTDKWDIAFSGIYNSSIWANHGEVIFENGNKGPGYGSPAKGGVYLVQDAAVEAKYYDKVKKLPAVMPIPITLFDEAYNNLKMVSVADDKFLSRGYLSLDHFLGSGDGYAYYDFYGSMFPGNVKKAHVVYNLPRPIIIKTAKGNYVKLIIYSFYKGKPENPSRDNQAPYLSFKYTILKDGSKDFTKVK